jgi:hypothetical protein
MKPRHIRKHLKVLRRKNKKYIKSHNYKNEDISFFNGIKFNYKKAFNYFQRKKK